MLFRGIIDKDIESSVLLQRAFDNRATERFITDVAGHRHTSHTFLLYHALGFGRILTFFQVTQDQIGPLFCVGYRHGPADTAVTACYKRHFAGELAATDMGRLLSDRLLLHGRLMTG